MKLKIFHSADIQVNCAGKHYNRFNEYEYMLKVMAETVLKGGYNLVVLAGDMFERHNANDTERGLLVNEFLRPVLDADIKVLWTDGNHDLKQRDFTFDPGDGSVSEEVNVLRALTNYINHPNLIYAEETNFYPLGKYEVGGITKEVIASVWAHKSKYSAEDKPLNPWFVLSQKSDDVRIPFERRLENSLVFDVFHDPVKDSKNWDGKTVRGNNDERVHIDEFKGAFALMGDIHMPDVIRSESRPKFFATYPSSPIICYFSEGDYYNNFDIVQSSNELHGFNEITFDSDGDAVITWKRLNNYTKRNTIELNEFATIADAEKFELKNPSEILNMIKFRLTSYESIEVLDAVIKNLHSKYNCVITTESDYNKAIGVESSLSDKFDVSNLSDREYLIDLAKRCIEDKVNSSKDTEEYKERLISDTLVEFTKALDRIQYHVPISKYRFNWLKLTNFMPITELHINFDDFRNISNIVKINGNNGTGKTTIFKGISWVANGKIDSRQADNRSKQNNLDYFNDKAWDVDTTTGGISVTRENDEIIVERALTRIWKAKTTDAQKKQTDWKNFVTSVNEEIQVKLNGQVLPDVDAKELINDVFGGFDKFQSLHVINQASLDNMLLNLPLNDLINHILKSIGFTMTEQLNAGKDKIQADIFDGLTKHGKDVAGINTDINIKDNEINLTNEEIESIKTQLDETTTTINKLTASEVEKAGKLHNISQQDLDDHSNKAGILARISELQLNVENTKKIIDTPVWSPEKESELQTFKSLFKSKNDDLIEKTKAVGEKNQLISNKQLIISANKTEMQKISNEFNSGIQQKVNELRKKQNASLTEIQTMKAGIISKINEGILKHNVSIDNQVKELEETQAGNKANVSKVDIGINTLNTQNATKNEEKQKLLSGSCNVCDKSYAELPKVVQEVAEIDAVISANDGKIKQLHTGLDGLNTMIKQTQASIDELKATKKTTVTELSDEVITDELQAEYASYKTLVASVDTATVEAQIKALEETKIDGEEKAQILKLNAENTSIQSEIDTLQGEVNAMNETVAKIPAEIQNINLEISSLETFRDQNSEASLYKKLIEIQAQLQDENTKLNKINDTDIKIKENEELKKEIQEVKNAVVSYKDSQLKFNDNISKLQIKLTTLKMNKEQLENQIEEIKAYEHANNIWKILSHTIGNKGLNKYVFDTVAMQINAELNGILDGLNYRIFFDLSDGYQLKMVDLLGQESVRNLYTIGGMESTLGALALVAIIKSKTIKNNGDFIFIDEITGKLNSSQDTKGSMATNKDYQLEFFQILNKLAENTNIAIIDHVLPIDWFKGRIDVVKYDNGKSELISK